MSEKITIKDVLAAIDLGERHLWDSLTADQRKDVTFFTVNRWASSIKSRNIEEQELAILKTNEYLNKHFFVLNKHPQLLWYLAAMTGNDDKKIQYHEWIGYKKKTDDNKAIKFLESQFPNKKDDEIELLAKLNSKANLKDYAKSLGLDDKDIKKIL